MTFERWDVVAALFPFVDIPARKPRPVLVLSSADFNLAHGHLVAGMITTGARSSWPSDEPIQDLAAAGLRHPSVVRFKLFTLGHQVIAKRVGSLGVEDRRRVSGKLDTVLLR